MPTNEKLLHAYLAGFIDADGSITIVTARTKNRTQYCVKLSAHNCKIAPIEILQKTFGGGKLRNTRRGKVKLHPNWRACYEWTLTKNKAAIAIRALLPYLVIKKGQALLCLKLDDLKKSYSSAERRWNPELSNNLTAQFEELKTKINTLNKRGQ